tara:strand:- start:5850 stop:6713 length:864 start_codon:yes stop_codon:yes gene_type:complete
MESNKEEKIDKDVDKKGKKQKSLEVLPVNDPEEQDDWGTEVHENLPQVGGFGGGSLTLIIGAVRTGKSTLLSNFFLNPEFYGQELFDYVKIMSNTISNDITSRFMKEAFDVSDYYDDSIISGIIENQKKFDKKSQPKIAIIADDLLGSVPRSGLLWSLCSRYRHYNIRMLIISSQNYRQVSPIARQNCQNLIITSPFPNQKEMLKISEEFGDVLGGDKQFLKIFKYATPDRYDTLHINLQDNPVTAWRNFTEKIATGNVTHFDTGSVDIGEYEGKEQANEAIPKEDL